MRASKSSARLCMCFHHRADQDMLPHKDFQYFSYDSVPMHKTQQ